MNSTLRLIALCIVCLVACCTVANAATDDVGILTPAPPAEPRINGPRIYGCKPTHPFIYRIPSTGQRPITFAAENLPDGLKLDSTTGIISGAVSRAGEYRVSLKAENSAGNATRLFRIVCGETLALTPPMGFNDWYAYYDRVTDKAMRKAADCLISSGMADAGYQYINIDDCWNHWAKDTKPADEKRAGTIRDKDGHILPNEFFPDMPALTNYIHAKGLKAGIYSSPGPTTCTGYTGSYKHEADDLDQISRWGFDFLKYDWCSYGETLKTNAAPTLEEAVAPYFLMGILIKKEDRDIVYNLCQYGMNDVWKWGAKVGGNAWRTGGDLGFELQNIFDVALKNAQHADFCGPGGWNDPDYLQIGMIGDAKTSGLPHPCPFTHTEQYSFMSLWCLISAPLFYSGDMEHLDAFTLNVLCNPEVIDIDQDPLGRSAEAVLVGKDSYVLVKDLEDGSKAVGLCNRSSRKTLVFADWNSLGLKDGQIARDLWRQKDIGTFDKKIEFAVPAHGVLLLRLRQAPPPAAKPVSGAAEEFKIAQYIASYGGDKRSHMAPFT